VQQQHLMMSRQHPTHLQHHNYVGFGLGVGSVAAPIKGIPVTGQLKVYLYMFLFGKTRCGFSLIWIFMLTVCRIIKDLSLIWVSNSNCLH